MNAILKNIPNSITAVNLLCGVAATVFASKGAQEVAGLQAYYWAYIFIGAAAVADFLDGFVARLMKAYSNLGKELDSLCDLVSFGVAPAMLVFSAMERAGCGGWAWAALAIALFGALRLAKFNIDTRQTDTFIGLPIPANAIFWIGFTSLANLGMLPALAGWLWAAVILCESLLMVCSLRMMSLKFKNYALRPNALRYILIAAAVLFAVFFGLPGLLYLILFYILLSLFS